MLLSHVLRTLSDHSITNIYSEFTPELSYLNYTYAYSEYLMIKEPSQDTVPVPPVFSIREFDRSEGDAIDITYVGYKADIPVGILSVSGSPASACIHHVKIRKPFRRHSCGTYLVQAAAADFFSHHDCCLYLHVSGKNTAAVGLYKKCSFQIQEEIRFFKISVTA